MISQDFHDLMLAYVAGCADADECARLEKWLASGDVSAHAAYAEALAVLHSVPLAIDSIDPPLQLRQRVLTRCCKKSSIMLRWPQYALTALAACLAVALGLSLVQRNADAARWRDVQQVMASPDVNFAKMDVVPVSSNGSATAKGAYGRVLYCPVTKMYEVHVFNLAPPPSGRVYELWLITADKKPMPAGTFKMKENNSGMVLAQFDPGGSVIMAAITDEPEGGSQTPTGKMQLTGALAG